jgi:CHAD domain-containing protein
VQATQQTRRIPWWVMADDGSVGVEVVDDEVSVVGGPQTGLRYRELEVEVKSAPALLAVAVDALVTAGAAPSAAVSKGVRAMVGDTTLPPLVEIGGRPRPKQPAGDAVRHHVRIQVDMIVTQDLRVRRGRPDAVHQYRVAARRLRSVLQAFEPLVDEVWARSLRAELGWIASVLSQARDREVLEERFTNAIRMLPTDVDGAAALVAVRRHLDAELVEAQAGIDEAMASDRYLTLVDALHDAVEDTPLTALAEPKASAVLPPLADRAWRRLEKQARRLHDELEGHDDHWHRTRITAKRARYTVEACVPVFGGPAKKLARQLEQVTEMLGQHQDAAIAAELARQLALTTRGARAPFALGVLYAQQRAEVAALRHEFVEAWPRISAPEWRAWMAGRP